MAAKHHFIPQFYLDGFVDPASADHKNPYLWIADLEEGTVRKRSPIVAARFPGYYDLQGKEFREKSLLEKSLSTFESRAAKVIRRLRKQDFRMAIEDRYHLANFIGLQLGRVPIFRQHIDATLRQQASNWLHNYVSDDERLERKFGKNAQHFKQYVLADKAKVAPTRDFVMVSALNIGLDFAELIFSRSWMLLIAESGATFFTSDNPVGLLSPDAKPLNINFQGRNEKLEISFPISPACALLMHAHEEHEYIVPVAGDTVVELNWRIIPTIQRYIFCSTEEQGKWALRKANEYRPRG